VKTKVHKLGISIAYGCNRSCSNCTHFSNFGLSGMLTVEQADREMGLWSPRLEVDTFVLYGGEPTINQDLLKIIDVAAKHFPRVQLSTNGLLLHKIDGLPEMLKKTNTSIYVSRYSDVDFRPILLLLLQWRNQGIQITLGTYHWTLRYHGQGEHIEPYDDGDPEKSWQSCSSKWCFQLHDGKLWKCPHAAYLPLVKRKFPSLSPAWQPLLDYSPLLPSASDEEVREFVDRKVEKICGLCPAVPERSWP